MLCNFFMTFYPLVRGTDPRIRIQIRIRALMSRIPNTDLLGLQACYFIFKDFAAQVHAAAAGPSHERRNRTTV
jgi:hypothetical protein